MGYRTEGLRVIGYWLWVIELRGRWKEIRTSGVFCSY